MTKSILLILAFAGLAFTQCGTLTLNPDTGKLDCVGNASGAIGGSAQLNVYSLGASANTVAPGHIANVPITNQTSFLTGMNQKAVSITAAASIDIDMSAGNLFQVSAMGANITTVNFLNPVAAFFGTMVFPQDGTGGRTVALPAGFCTVTPTASVTTFVAFHVAADGTTVVGDLCWNTADPANHVLGAVFYQGGAALSSGTTAGQSLWYLAPLPFTCKVQSWSVTVDAGTAGFRVWRKASGTAIPTVSDTLNTGDLAISIGTNLLSTTMTNFTGSVAPTFTAGDILAIQLNAASTATFAVAALQCR